MEDRLSDMKNTVSFDRIFHYGEGHDNHRAEVLSFERMHNNGENFGDPKAQLAADQLGNRFHHVKLLEIEIFKLMSPRTNYLCGGGSDGNEVVAALDTVCGRKPFGTVFEGELGTPVADLLYFPGGACCRPVDRVNQGLHFVVFDLRC